LPRAIAIDEMNGKKRASKRYLTQADINILQE
jgi:hypothetical protein